MKRLTEVPTTSPRQQAQGRLLLARHARTVGFRASARVGIALVAIAAVSLMWLNASPAGASGSISYVQGAAAVAGAPVTTQTLTFTEAVSPGDFLVGWFAQYNSPGQVSVSDSVNGAWTRSVSETFNGSGDIALFFISNSAAAPQGLTITVTSSAPTYLQSSAAEYSGVAASNPLDQSAVNSGTGTSVSTGTTSAVPAGELVYSALTTGGNPGSVTPGTSQGVAFTARASTSNGTAYEQDVLSATAGAQQGTATLGSATDWHAVVATFTPASGSSGGGTGGTPTFQQSAAFSSGTLSTTAAFTLSRNVHAGDLLVGWFAQFNVPGQVTVSDNVNGAWTRAPDSLTFQSDTGDIALYYLANSKTSASGLTITVSAPTPAYLQGAAAEYSGMAVAGPLDQISSARGVGVAVSTGNTAPIASGELVYSGILTGSAPGSETPGQSQGMTYSPRAQTASGASYEQDILSATAGAQVGTATLGTSADWYAVAATFRVYPNDTSPPGAPSTLASLSTASSRVALSWSPGSGDLTGYAVYRNGQAIGTTAPGQTTYLDTTVTGGTTYSYTVEAFDGAGLSSGPTNTVGLTTPVSSPVFIQGTAASPGSRLPSLTLTLSQPVVAGDLLVGWFGQYNAPGQVQVSDNVNGAWTRGPSETFTSGTGDIALEYVANTKAAPNGLTITVTASAPAYLQEAIAEFRGVNTVNPLATAVVGIGSSAAVSMGPTASVPSGDLLIGATLTSGQPGSVVAGSSQGVPFSMDVQNGSASANLEDILATAAGPQSATETLGSASTAYTVVAVFSTTAASAPTSVSVSGPASVTVGTAYSAQASAAGANPAATYSLVGAPSWLSVDPNAGTITGSIPTGITSFSYAVTASNSQGSVTSPIQTVTVATGTTSLALSPNPPAPVAAGVPVTYTATVAETSGSGALAGSVSFTDNGGSLAFCTNLVVSGGSAACTTSFATTGTHTVGASYGADPNFTGSSASVSQVVTAQPQFTSVTTTTAVVGQAMSFTVTTTGYPTANLTETGALPKGLTFTGNANGTATMSGTPAAGTGGSYNLTVNATNSTGSVAQSFVLVVDQPPAITSARTTTATRGRAMTFTVTTTGYPKATITETGTLPNGLSFTANANGTATISGTPAAGTNRKYALTIMATNGVGSPATQAFVLTVR
jgi:Bacterial Ig-like domain (group 3)/Putative Ig domain